MPPPEQPLLTRLSEAQLAEEIERYIDYVDATGRSVHLGGSFVHHFHTRPDDNALPLAAAIATLPIILGDGTLLGDRGLDRDRGIIFRVPNELLAIIPRPEACTPSAIAATMRFLTDEWLVDVASDYSGKCILIAAALTVIERSVLANRPTFWVTAGRRGGGKTTVIIMLLMAVTGVWPAAAAWSPNEEERRKALLAYSTPIWDSSKSSRVVARRLCRRSSLLPLSGSPARPAAVVWRRLAFAWRGLPRRRRIVRSRIVQQLPVDKGFGADSGDRAKPADQRNGRELPAALDPR